MGRQYGQDSEKGQLARAIKLREMEEESIKKQKIERYASIGFLALAVIVFVGCIFSANSFKAKAATTREELNATQKELSSLQEANANPELTTVEVDVVASSASDAGLAVCQAQNDLNAAIDAETKAGQVEFSEQHQEALNRLRTLFVDDMSNSRSVRNTWCTFGDWEFHGVHQFEGNYITVVWKCYAKDDVMKERLLSFVSAQYDATKNAFTHGDLYYTAWYESLANDSGRLVEGDQAGTDTGDGVGTGDTIDYSKYSAVVDNTSAMSDESEDSSEQTGETEDEETAFESVEENTVEGDNARRGDE